MEDSTDVGSLAEPYEGDQKSRRTRIYEGIRDGARKRAGRCIRRTNRGKYGKAGG